MTIAYPDVSNYEGNMLLEAATVAVCAKASEGTTYTDPYYPHFKAEAERVGAVFFGYHFLHAGNGAAQARHCFSVTGPGVNVMIDHEPTTGSNPSIQDAIDFATEYRALGGLCTLDYLPRWYWQQLGSPSLAPLAAAGLSLVASNYTDYSDNGPGWAPYGGLTPAIWQWTDALAYSGQRVDFNAFRGGVDQLRALLGYTAPAPAPTPDQEDTMQILRVQGSASVYGAQGGVLWGIAGPAGLQPYLDAGVQQITVPQAEIDQRLAVQPPTADKIAAALAALLPSGSGASAAQIAAALAPEIPTAAQIAHAQAVEQHNDTPAS